MDMRSLAVESVTLEVNETASFKAVICGGTTAFIHFIHGGLLLLLVCSSSRCCSIVDVSISILNGSSYSAKECDCLWILIAEVVDDDENAAMMQYCKLYSNAQTIIIGSSIVVRRLHLW